MTATTATSPSTTSSPSVAAPRSDGDIDSDVDTTRTLTLKDVRAYALRMGPRRQLYLAAIIGGSISYLFNVLAFTGEFFAFRWVVFMVLFLLVTIGFERLIAWAEAMENA